MVEEVSIIKSGVLAIYGQCFANTQRQMETKPKFVRTDNIEEDERFEVRLPSSLFGKNLDKERDREVDKAINRLKYEKFLAENKKMIEYVLEYIRKNPSCENIIFLPHNAKMAERIAEWIFTNHKL